MEPRRTNATTVPVTGYGTRARVTKEEEFCNTKFKWQSCLKAQIIISPLSINECTLWRGLLRSFLPYLVVCGVLQECFLVAIFTSKTLCVCWYCPPLPSWHQLGLQCSIAPLNNNSNINFGSSLDGTTTLRVAAAAHLPLPPLHFWFVPTCGNLYSNSSNNDNE